MQKKKCPDRDSNSPSPDLKATNLTSVPRRQVEIGILNPDMYLQLRLVHLLTYKAHLPLGADKTHDCKSEAHLSETDCKK